MTTQRDYNQIYTLGRFILQIMQDSQADGIVVDLLPCVTLVINGPRLIVGLGMQWICGTVNIGIMTKDFTVGEKKRREKIKELAAKMGVTPRQYALRWGW